MWRRIFWFLKIKFPICDNSQHTQCVTNIRIYSNIFNRILDFRIRIMKFLPTNIFGYLDNWSTIFEYLIIQIFLQMKPFPPFEALFKAALVWLLSQNTLRVLTFLYLNIWWFQTNNFNILIHIRPKVNIQIYSYSYSSQSWHLEYIRIHIGC